MNLLLKLIVFIVPTTFLLLFFMILTNEDTYPGADYDQFLIPEFELKVLDNTITVNNDLLNGDYVLNVWASWCITCIIEHPYLTSLSKNGIPVIGLNYKDEQEDAIIWLKKYGNPYQTILHDYKGNLALDLGVTGAPETFLISDGKVIAHYQGEVNDQIWNDVFLPIIKDRKMF
ncbi:MAG: DsbE family thiol:disulfide interchange protein [SAR86 cluster bacterium]|jgi:cytochrome c biogenesis protein CcmG/thiol:disulfide interchange protein DsbE|uniref:DsbE family thiol:disulfide interchange protein n=1 Tax=SAR86 cluster bacterium TaxID=2030880 RepID=A0A520N2L1_9GAMM|nr:MAG: DsbE family thiol:disulfide interchange protein [SAR86 cluster bacterium]|tara:strand:+ start:2354 stop:2875 length:522 start_codon:yes stop_codon:yes gene_type:complete